MYTTVYRAVYIVHCTHMIVEEAAAFGIMAYFVAHSKGIFTHSFQFEDNKSICAPDSDVQAQLLDLFTFS